MDFKAMADYARSHNGGSFTIDDTRINGELATFKKGYLVSLPNLSYVCTDEEFGADTLNWYVNTQHPEFFGSDSVPAILGVWFDVQDEEWYVDISDHYNTYEVASLAGKLGGQVAIWGVENGESIYL